MGSWIYKIFLSAIVLSAVIFAVPLDFTIPAEDSVPEIKNLQELPYSIDTEPEAPHQEITKGEQEKADVEQKPQGQGQTLKTSDKEAQQKTPDTDQSQQRDLVPLGDTSATAKVEPDSQVTNSHDADNTPKSEVVSQDANVPASGIPSQTGKQQLIAENAQIDAVPLGDEVDDESVAHDANPVATSVDNSDHAKPQEKVEDKVEQPVQQSPQSNATKPENSDSTEHTAGETNQDTAPSDHKEPNSLNDNQAEKQSESSPPEAQEVDLIPLGTNDGKDGHPIPEVSEVLLENPAPVVKEEPAGAPSDSVSEGQDPVPKPNVNLENPDVPEQSETDNTLLKETELSEGDPIPLLEGPENDQVIDPPLKETDDKGTVADTIQEPQQHAAPVDNVDVKETPAGTPENQDGMEQLETPDGKSQVVPESNNDKVEPNQEVPALIPSGREVDQVLVGNVSSPGVSDPEIPLVPQGEVVNSEVGNQESNKDEGIETDPQGDLISKVQPSDDDTVDDKSSEEETIDESEEDKLDDELSLEEKDGKAQEPSLIVPLLRSDIPGLETGPTGNKTNDLSDYEEHEGIPESEQVIPVPEGESEKLAMKEDTGVFPYEKVDDSDLKEKDPETDLNPEGVVVPEITVPKNLTVDKTSVDNPVKTENPDEFRDGMTGESNPDAEKSEAGQVKTSIVFQSKDNDMLLSPEIHLQNDSSETKPIQQDENKVKDSNSPINEITPGAADATKNCDQQTGDKDTPLNDCKDVSDKENPDLVAPQSTEKEVKGPLGIAAVPLLVTEDQNSTNKSPNETTSSGSNAKELVIAPTGVANVALPNLDDPLEEITVNKTELDATAAKDKEEIIVEEPVLIHLGNSEDEPIVGETKEGAEEDNGFQWPILVAALIAGLVCFVLGLIVSACYHKSPGHKRKTRNVEDGSARSAMIPPPRFDNGKPSEGTPMLQANDPMMFPQKQPTNGAPESVDTSETDGEKARVPAKRSHTFPKMQRKTFYDSRELSFIDDVSDDEEAQALGRPPYDGFEPRKKPKIKNLKKRLSKLLDGLEDPVMSTNDRSGSETDFARVVENFRRSMIEPDPESDTQPEPDVAETTKLLDATPTDINNDIIITIETADNNISKINGQQVTDPLLGDGQPKTA